MARRADSPIEPLTTPAPALQPVQACETPVHPSVWLAFNVLCAAGVVLPGLTANSPALVLGWLVCLLLNLVGAGYMMRWLVPQDGAPLSQGLAAVLGLVWGVGVSLIAAPLPLPLLFIALLSGSAAIGATVPMMAVAAPSWIAMMAGWFAPTTWLLATRDPGLAATWGGLILPLFMLFARRQQELAAEVMLLRRGIARLHRQARVQGLAVTVDPLESATARAQIAALAQCLDENAHAAATLAALPEALVRVDRDGRIVYLNRAAERMTRTRLAAALGRPVQDIVDLAAADEDKLTAHLIEQCFAAGTPQHSPARTWLRRADGRVLAVDCSVAPVDDVQHRIEGLVFALRDVTAAHAEGQLLAWCATHDGLTSLPDRTHFEARIADLLAANGPDAAASHAICVLDIDGFGELNELYGLPAGDRVLRELASVLREEVTAAALIARTGEDEFGVCFEHCTLEQAREAAERLRVAIEAHRVQWQTARIGVQVSIGIAAASRHRGPQVAALIRATRACRLAKRAGGNRVHTLSDDETRRPEGIGARATDPGVLRSALERDRIAFALMPARPLDEAVMQPGYAEFVLQLAGDAVRLEGNLRASQARLAAELDRRRFAAAIHALRSANPYLGAYDIIGIDVSAASLLDTHYTNFVLSLLAPGGTLGPRVCFEISATTAPDSIEHCAEFAAAVRARGCHLALDGFGTGDLSFQLLKRLRPDFVKIDADFVHRLGTSTLDYEIVLGMTRVARAMNVKIIADGVATLAARELLVRMGVDFIQGPLAGPARPLPVALT